MRRAATTRTRARPIFATQVKGKVWCAVRSEPPTPAVGYRESGKVHNEGRPSCNSRMTAHNDPLCLSPLVEARLARRTTRVGYTSALTC